MKRYCLSTALLAVLMSMSASGADEIGQWDFNSGNLAKTAGASLGDLQFYDGPSGPTDQGTVFGTTAALGIPNIGGASASVMAFPACTISMGYVMPTPTNANGTNEFFNVNSYTLVMDLLFTGDAANAWRALLQTDGFNGGDGDFFIRSDGGIGISGTYSGKILSNTWHRVGIVFDKPGGVLRKYIDGTLVGSQPYDGQDGRFSLLPASSALLFSDEDNETAPGYVNSIQLRDRALSSAEIGFLGGATAAGIPMVIPVFNLAVTVAPTNTVGTAGMTVNCFTASIVSGAGPFTYQWYRNGTLLPGQTSEQLRLANVQASDAGNYTVVVNNGVQSATSSPPAVLTVEGPPPAFVTGQWDFKGRDLRATAGQPLQFFDVNAQAATTFQTTTDFGISDINGQSASVMRYAPSVVSGPSGGFIIPHGIAPNGGGMNVNQYTVIMDLMYPSWTSGYRALWQTDPTTTNDADVFINGSNGIGISSQYQGTLTPDVWHRVVFALDLTRRELGKYIDGTNVVAGPVGTAPFGPHNAQYLSAAADGSGGGIDQRWSLGPMALLFSDEDGELQEVYVSSIQVRNGRMTDASIAALGGPSAAKIPGFIQATRTGSSVRIDWTGTVLESAANPAGPWSAVNGAGQPYVVTSPAGNRFYRAR